VSGHYAEQNILWHTSVEFIQRVLCPVQARTFSSSSQVDTRSHATAADSFVTSLPRVLCWEGCQLLPKYSQTRRHAMLQGDTNSKLPALFLIKAYRALSRPYKSGPSATLLLLERTHVSLSARYAAELVHHEPPDGAPKLDDAENVKFIVLVRPSAMLSAMLVVLRPFLSLKAARKLHMVRLLL